MILGQAIDPHTLLFEGLSSQLSCSIQVSAYDQTYFVQTQDHHRLALSSEMLFFQLLFLNAIISKR